MAWGLGLIPRPNWLGPEINASMRAICFSFTNGEAEKRALMLCQSWIDERPLKKIELTAQSSVDSLRITFSMSGRLVGLTKYSATPALSALFLQSPSDVAESTIIGIPDVAGSFLSISIAFRVFMS
jgi:hypothetical protein